MKIKSFKDNTDSILINVNDVVLRCDTYQQYIDHLYLSRHSHRRALKSKATQDISGYDLENMLRETNRLINRLKIAPYHITNVYRHDRNDRFVLLETNKSLRIELDKELNGIKDRSKRTYSNMYKRKPDNYYRSAVVKEYLRIHKEISRTFELAIRIIRLRQTDF